MNPTDTSSPRYASLRDYLRVLREQLWVILVIVVAAGAVALLVSLREDPAYEATSSIAFKDQSQNLEILGGSVSPKTPTDQTPQARAKTINSPQVVSKVRKELKAKASVGELQSAISTSVDEDTFLVTVTARWGGQEFATRLANAFATEAAKSTNRRTAAQLSSALKSVRKQLDSIQKDPTKAAQQAALSDQLTRLKFLLSNNQSAQVVERAQGASQVAPRTLRNTALGLLLGLVIGVAVAFLRDSLDRRLRDAREIQRELDLPLIGFVRQEALGGVAWLASKDHPLAPEDLEGFRILRQNLYFLDVDSPPRTILITSALPEEGKSTVADSLAGVAALQGRRTLLVECDLRRPTLAKRLGLKPGPGLSDYLASQATPAEVVQTVSIDGGSGAGSNGSNSKTWRSDALPLACVTAGTPSPHPTELLQSEQFKAFLASVSEAYETVILDTSPLLPVADTLELVPVVDAVLVCVRSRQTTREQALAAKAALSHFPQRPTALVVTGLRRRDAEEYGYYSYGYSYGSAATAAAVERAGNPPAGRAG